MTSEANINVSGLWEETEAHAAKMVNNKECKAHKSVFCLY